MISCNKTVTTKAALAVACISGSAASFNLFADDGVGGDLPLRARSHAPIGVMGDHLHAKGEYMLSYRHMYMAMDGHRLGEERLSTMEVYQRGFSSAAESMEMNMDMFGFMYAPSNDVTLMLMANYLDMEMDMVSHADDDMAHGDHGMDAAHGMHDGHGMGAMSHGTSGWGDIGLSALIRGWENETHRFHWNVGVSAPTGSVTEMMHGQFQPYGMQLGSGTWDAKLGGTYAGHSDAWGWGAQVLGTIRLEDEGESGFARSDAFEASVWGDWSLRSSLSVSTRLKYSAEGALDGHYNGPHAHAAPPHFQANYGGDVLEGLLGLNFVFQDGALRGHRVALEVGLPIYQQLNGVGMNREESVQLGWQYAW